VNEAALSDSVTVYCGQPVAAIRNSETLQRRSLANDEHGPCWISKRAVTSTMHDRDCDRLVVPARAFIRLTRACGEASVLAAGSGQTRRFTLSHSHDHLNNRIES